MTTPNPVSKRTLKAKQRKAAPVAEPMVEDAYIANLEARRGPDYGPDDIGLVPPTGIDEPAPISAPQAAPAPAPATVAPPPQPAQDAEKTATLRPGTSLARLWAAMTGTRTMQEIADHVGMQLANARHRIRFVLKKKGFAHTVDEQGRISRA
jgi:hypothetical protein